MDKYEKFKIITTGVSVVFIPVVLALVGNWYTSSIKNNEIQGDFVRLAVEILKEEPKPESKNLRIWAANVIDQYSGVSLGKDAFEELVNQMKLTMSRDFEVFVPSFREATKSISKISAERFALLIQLKLEGKLTAEEVEKFTSYEKENIKVVTSLQESLFSIYYNSSE